MNKLLKNEFLPIFSDSIVQSTGQLPKFEIGRDRILPIWIILEIILDIGDVVTVFDEIPGLFICTQNLVVP